MPISTPPDFPDWDPSDLSAALKRVYAWSVANAQSQIGWYAERKKTKRAGSQWFRALSIIFAGAGALCPLLDATDAFGGADKVALGQWGYVLLAVAAGIVGYDRYFGFSTGWMRYVVTQMALEKALKEFRYDWSALWSQQTDPQAPSAILFLQKARDFTLQVENLVRQETDAWVLEFQNSITQLEKVLKSESEARRPGSIKVRVPNADKFRHVVVQLNGREVKRFEKVTEGLLESIPRGSYEMTLIGEGDGGTSHKESRVVEVTADTMTSLEVTLPSA